MKTILVILITLFFSQWLYLNYGPKNPVARLTAVASETASVVCDAVKRFVH